MSVSDDNISTGDYSYDESENQSGVYENERGDRFSEESSGYYVRETSDPTSRNPKYVKRLNPDTKKRVRVEFFPSSSVSNAPIKNAMTGAFQGTGARIFRVGSKDEDLFFSVILATGELGPDAPTLFYDNPEQYERHFMTKLPQAIKDKWTIKSNSAIFRLKLEKPTNSAGVVLIK
jgi:hypothetical protein